MSKHQLAAVIDFGGQYNQLIARRVRECGVYSEVFSCTVPLGDILERKPAAIIFTGGPASVFAPGAPTIDPAVFTCGVPVLGICYGVQLMAHLLGGEVRAAEVREYGKTELHTSESVLFDGVPDGSICWMSHTNYVDKLPEGFVSTATTASCATAAIENRSKKLYGVQFHPEVLHTEYGTKILKNFLYNVCGASGDWKIADYMTSAIASLREKVGEDERVLLALSGGVDSSVLAALLSKAIGKRLTCVFVDHGFLRKNEGDEVEKVFTEDFDVDFIRANEQDRFLSALAGVEEPERKRKLIGAEFINVFEEYAKKVGKVDYLAQGTIYPDVIESGTGSAAVIKSHHNVGGLPERMDFKGIIEPLRLLFKDEVRALGLELGLPENIVYRQPFPGPGLAIRVVGEVTREKLEVVREADAIFREEIASAGLARQIGQYFAAMSNTKTVGVMGDERTFEYVIVLRAVTTTDFMTADWFRVPYDVLERVSNRIVNEVKHTNRIVYDVTSKPPATIEWE